MSRQLVKKRKCLEHTLIVVPFSARNRAIIFMLRPLIAAKAMGNMVGPCSPVNTWLVGVLGRICNLPSP
jgi:hypothetical protein